jgi:hypothetical protein
LPHTQFGQKEMFAFHWKEKCCWAIKTARVKVVKKKQALTGISFELVRDLSIDG